MLMCTGGYLDQGQPFPRTLLWLNLSWINGVLHVAEQGGELRATSTWSA